MKPGVLAVDDSVARDIEAQFRAHIADTAFPCVGAKSTCSSRTTCAAAGTICGSTTG